MKIGDLIKKERLNKNIGMRELGRIIGATGAYVFHIENNKRTNHLKKTIRLLIALDIPLEKLSKVDGFFISKRVKKNAKLKPGPKGDK